jgi:hypothetical protein
MFSDNRAEPSKFQRISGRYGDAERETGIVDEVRGGCASTRK